MLYYNNNPPDNMLKQTSGYRECVEMADGFLNSGNIFFDLIQVAPLVFRRRESVYVYDNEHVSGTVKYFHYRKIAEILHQRKAHSIWLCPQRDRGRSNAPGSRPGNLEALENQSKKCWLHSYSTRSGSLKQSK